MKEKREKMQSLQNADILGSTSEICQFRGK